MEHDAHCTKYHQITGSWKFFCTFPLKGLGKNILKKANNSGFLNLYLIFKTLIKTSKLKEKFKQKTKNKIYRYQKKLW